MECAPRSGGASSAAAPQCGSAGGWLLSRPPEGRAWRQFHARLRTNRRVPGPCATHGARVVSSRRVQGTRVGCAGVRLSLIHI